MADPVAPFTPVIPGIEKPPVPPMPSEPNGWGGPAKPFGTSPMSEAALIGHRNGYDTGGFGAGPVGEAKPSPAETYSAPREFSQAYPQAQAKPYNFLESANQQPQQTVPAITPEQIKQKFGPGPALPKPQGNFISDASNVDYTNKPDTSLARQGWNFVNRNTGGLPGFGTNLVAGSVGNAIPTPVKDLATTPLTSYAGLGNPKLNAGDWIDKQTDGGLSSTVSPELKNVLNVGTSPLELLPWAAAARPARGLFGGSRAAPAVEAAEATVPAVPRFSTGPGGVQYPIPPVPKYPVPPRAPAPTTPTPSTPVPAAGVEAATQAPKVAPGWLSALNPLTLSPGRGVVGAEIASGAAPFTNTARAVMNSGKAVGNLFGRNLPEAGANAGAAAKNLAVGAVGAGVPAAFSTGVPTVLGESEADRRTRLNDSPTQNDLSLQGVEPNAPRTTWDHIQQKATLGPRGLFNQITDPLAKSGPTALSTMGAQAKSVGDLVSFAGNNPIRAVETVGRIASTTGGGEERQFNDLARQYRGLTQQYNDAVAANPTQKDQLLAKFRTDVTALEEQAKQIPNKLTNNVEDVRQGLVTQDAINKLKAEYQGKLDPDTFGSMGDVFKNLDQTLPPINQTDARYLPPPTGTKPENILFGAPTGADIAEAHLSTGRPYANKTPTKLDPLGQKKYDDAVEAVAARQRPRLDSWLSKNPGLGSPAGIAVAATMAGAAAPMTQPTTPQATPVSAPAPPTSPVEPGPVQGPKPPQEVAQNIQKNIADVGIEATMAGAAAAPPPPGLEGYWKGLDSSSKALIIGGLSMAAVMTLRSMFRDENDTDESFISKVLPILGVGAAAWGAGGGSFSATPSMATYKQLGQAVGSNFDDLKQRFLPSAPTNPNPGG